MLAMLSSVTLPKLGIFSRLRRFVCADNGVIAGNEVVFGAPAVHITIEIEQNIKPRVLANRLRSAEKVMSGYGVKYVCFERGFLHRDFFTERAYKEPDKTILYESTAAQAVRLLPGAGGTAYFCAPRLSGAAFSTLEALCVNYRSILADIAAGDKRELLDLQRRLGVSIISKPSPERILEANAAVFMGAGNTRTLLSPDCAVYAVNDFALEGVTLFRRVTGLSITLPTSRESELRSTFSREGMISFALESMTLARSDLTLTDITLSNVL